MTGPSEPPPPSAPSSTTARTSPTWVRRYGGPLRRLKALVRLRRLYLLKAELQWAPTETQRLFALTVGIGVACGFAAVAFHLSINLFTRRLIDRALGAPGWSWMVWTILVPTLGGVVCGWLLEYVVPNARGSGIPQVKAAFSQQGGRVRGRDAAGKFLLASLQIGSGASLGREGPTVQICGGIASVLGRLFGVSAKSQRRLLPVGVAAGIAAAFNAPIAAVTFTIEEIVGKLDQSVLSGVIVAAAFAAVIERSVLGEDAVFSVPASYGLHHASSLLVYAALGLSAAVVSLVFTDSLLRLRGWFRTFAKVPRWARPGIGGAVTGSLAVIALHTLGVRGVTGGGYETLGQALTGQLALKALLALCAMKLVATVFSYASGGAGGIFAPILFIGGTLGGAFGVLDVRLLGHAQDSLGAFALVGMGAVFAGTIRAPITSILIIVEMTRGYSLILPLMIANMTAYVLARRWRPVPIYEALLAQDGVVLRDKPTGGDVLEQQRVQPLVNSTGPFHSFNPAAPASQVSQVINLVGTQHVYPVLGLNRQLLGIITQDDLGVLQADPDFAPVATAFDLMRAPVSVEGSDDLRTALEAMLQHGIREVPVTDATGRFLGFVDDSAVSNAYSRHRQPRVAARPNEASQK